MTILVILSHPSPGSFNHALAETACSTLLQDAHVVLFHNLAAVGFARGCRQGKRSELHCPPATVKLPP